jgi:hypothetical protein
MTNKEIATRRLRLAKLLEKLKKDPSVPKIHIVAGQALLDIMSAK